MWSRSLRISEAEGGSLREELVGDRARADLERLHPVDSVGDGAEDDLRRAAADVDDADVALDRMAERLGRADEGQAALLLLGEDLDLDAGDLLDLLHGLLAVLGVADRRRRNGADRLGAELLGELDLRATTSATSAIFSLDIEPSRFVSAPICV